MSKTDVGMFGMFGQIVTPAKKAPTAQKVLNRSATFSSPWKPLGGILRHSKVHLVQCDALCSLGALYAIL